MPSAPASSLICNPTFGNTATTTPVSVASGSFVVCFISAISVKTISNVRDVNGHAFTKLGSTNAAGGATHEVWYRENVTGSASYTVSADLSGNEWFSITGLEVAGVTATALDQFADYLASGSPFASNTTGATTQNNEMVLAIMAMPFSFSGAEVVTWGSGFATAVSAIGLGNGVNRYIGYKNVSSTGAQQMTGTTLLDATDAVTWLLTLKDSGSGGGGAQPVIGTRTILGYWNR